MDQIRTPVFPVGKPPKTHKASQARYNLTRFVDSKYHGVQTCRAKVINSRKNRNRLADVSAKTDPAPRVADLRPLGAARRCQA